MVKGTPAEDEVGCGGVIWLDRDNGIQRNTESDWETAIIFTRSQGQFPKNPGRRDQRTKPEGKMLLCNGTPLDLVNLHLCGR